MMNPMHPHQLPPGGKRMLVSAPRPDSFMLRMRSLREAGRLAPGPAAQTWQKAEWAALRLERLLRDELLPNTAR